MPINDIMTTITSGLTGALTGMGQGIGAGIKEMINALAFDTVTVDGTATTTVSVLFTMVIVFAGVSLAISLGRKIWGFITSLGKKK